MRGIVCAASLLSYRCNGAGMENVPHPGGGDLSFEGKEDRGFARLCGGLGMEITWYLAKTKFWAGE